MWVRGRIEVGRGMEATGRESGTDPDGPLLSLLPWLFPFLPLTLRLSLGFGRIPLRPARSFTHLEPPPRPSTGSSSSDSPEPPQASLWASSPACRVPPLSPYHPGTSGRRRHCRRGAEEAGESGAGRRTDREVPRGRGAARKLLGSPPRAGGVGPLLPTTPAGQGPFSPRPQAFPVWPRCRGLCRQSGSVARRRGCACVRGRARRFAPVFLGARVRGRAPTSRRGGATCVRGVDVRGVCGAVGAGGTRTAGAVPWVSGACAHTCDRTCAVCRPGGASRASSEGGGGGAGVSLRSLAPPAALAAGVVRASAGARSPPVGRAGQRGPRRDGDSGRARGLGRGVNDSRGDADADSGPKVVPERPRLTRRLRRPRLARRRPRPWGEGGRLRGEEGANWGGRGAKGGTSRERRPRRGSANGRRRTEGCRPVGALHPPSPRPLPNVVPGRKIGTWPRVTPVAVPGLDP